VWFPDQNYNKRVKNKWLIGMALATWLLSLQHAHSQSVLNSGQWFKFAVEKRGVHKIDFNLLRNAGLDLSNLDPRKLRLYGQGGGMLPQANATPRPNDLVENAIFVSGEDDGKFDSGDFILFFAEGADEVRFDTQRNTFYYEHNLYADKNFYFLTVSDNNGLRIAPQPSIAGSYPVVNTFDDFAFHETDQHNELTSGRQWFGETFDAVTEHKFTFDASNIVAGSAVKWVSHVMAQSFAPATGSSFKLFFNGNQVAEQTIPSLSTYRYGLKGGLYQDTLTLDAGTMAATQRTNQEVSYQYTKATGRSTGYLDFFLVSFVRTLALYGDQTLFRSAASTAQATSTFQVANAAGATIWNVTDPNKPTVQEFSTNGSTAIFSANTGTLQELIVFNGSHLAPTFEAQVGNQNLHGSAPVNMLIITHADFQSEADRLAAHRQNHTGLSVEVVPINNIYNEYSSGRQDVTAIRDFIRSRYLKDPATLKGVLLMGRGSYDYKSRITNNTNFIPIYEARNSLDPLKTYASDDYFGFMEDNEGEWTEGDAPVNHTIDVPVGRLPVRRTQDAADLVDKIIDYETNTKNYGRWRKQITFVADDGNSEDNFTSTHQDQANKLAEFVEANDPGFDTRKIFLGIYNKEVKPSGEVIPEANDAIVKAFDQGSVILNYTGHGSERVWADEKVLTEFSIPELKNKLRPFLVTATCEFGRQDDPQQISSAELCLLQPDGGAIGLVSTSRPVSSSTNFELNRAFYDALLARENGQHLTVGELFRHTKNNSTSGVSNRNFSLMGDPLLHLALPQYKIVVTSLQTQSNSTTLKALSKVIVQGQVQDGAGNKLEDYKGTLEATLFDKRTAFKTIGKNNPAFNFTQWYNALFRGKASVKNGEFTFEFIMPKNIAYETGQGKLSIYASDLRTPVDAAGAELNFDIGGTETGVAADNTPPAIQLFVGDTTFRNGGIATPNTTLVARLHDQSGINLSSYGVGNDLMAQLDGEGTVFILNDYYVADEDDFTSGTISYPLNGLKPGKHTLTLKAWDTHNNPAEATITFYVTDNENLVVEFFGNYPNPAAGKTTFFFMHNRSNDDLEGTLWIFNTTGSVQKTLDFTTVASPYKVELPEFELQSDSGKILGPGLYLVRLVVRSLSNGSKNERVTKLIVLN
jgi:hypothetical protein